MLNSVVNSNEKHFEPQNVTYSNLLDLCHLHVKRPLTGVILPGLETK
jgi:hypothetical protein